jgi:hypothetical protein
MMRDEDCQNKRSKQGERMSNTSDKTSFFSVVAITISSEEKIEENSFYFKYAVKKSFCHILFYKKHDYY